ncbi:glucosaminidase domain-containing protein [Dictyobacter formicarum]|uniref:Putative zinc-finger domain-containing protein n=1 Tax=Dictyobacter formicarum TaxID=2778368 RepID=A0ABQ3VTQ1_9CHLR|nr:glucosaminidase domain-containing protein [Dictyobacter formicarum]GHO88691.1 hypothetical protein KSZ_66970 [Dictyobacter formicarum]
MMNVKPCAAWAEKLNSSHNDALSDRELAELEAHIATCADCAAAQAQYAILTHRTHNVNVNGMLPAPTDPDTHARHDQHEPASDASPSAIGMLQSQKAMWARRKARRVRTVLEVVACIGVLVCVLLVLLAIFHPAGLFTAPGGQPARIPGVLQPIPAAGFNVVGDPTISAKQINAILVYYHSPAAGKGQALYDLGVQYHIDPVVALAFFHHESTFGKFGEASYTHSLGNLRCMQGYPCVDKKRGGYAQFASWEDGFAAWYKLIHNLYVTQWKLTTVNQIISKYAPVKDKNAPLHRNYVAFINLDIALWRSGKVHP